MNSFQRDIAATVRSLQGLAGNQTFTWKGKEVAILPGSERRGTVLEVGGFEEDIDVQFITLFSEWLTSDSTLVTADSELYTSDNDTPAPVAGKRVTFRGRTYKVVAVKWDPSVTYMTLYLADPNRARG